MKTKTRENVFYQNQQHVEIATFFNDIKFMMHEMTETEKQKDHYYRRLQCKTTRGLEARKMGCW